MRSGFFVTGVRRLLFCTVIAVTFGTGCNSPSSPSPPPPPPPPPPAAPTLQCEDGVTRATINPDGLAISFPTPEARDGQTPVTVSCTPASGAMFPIGLTTVRCTATDALQRQAACEFNVTITRAPQLQRVRFLAFGDSITAGEVTFPGLTEAGKTSSKQVVVPSAAYPTVLQRLLQTRYSFQADTIVVANHGLGGEKAVVARDRFFAAMNSVRPDVVLLWHGHNDYGSGANGAASAAASEVRTMAIEAARAGARVFIATPVPPRPGGNRTQESFLVLDYANRMRDVAAREGAVLVDIYGHLLPDVFRYIGVDGLHPNEAGYARIAELWFDAIRNALEVRPQMAQMERR
jgi:lysophospholipase L1-like esterase